MKKMIYILLLVLTVSGLNCSSDDSITSPEQDQVVVKAFIYTGEPIYDVRLTSTLPLGSTESSAPSINDADVRIIKAGVEYPLVLSPGDSGYYHYPGDDFSIQTGDTIQFEAEYNGVIIHGETYVPDKPSDVTLTNNTLIYPTEIGWGWFNSPEMQNSMTTLKWKNDDNSLYYVTVSNIDPNPIAVNEDAFPARGKFNFVSRPTIADSVRVMFNSFTHLGLHRATVYRINQEYADLYYTQTQDSRDLNEPLTNIINGLGVFSAFNSSSVEFIVKY